MESDQAVPARIRHFPAPSSRVLMLLASLVVLYWAGFFIRDALGQFSMIDWRRAGKGDVAVDWKAAQLFWRGISPYSPEGLKSVGVLAFGHPPTTPFWFLSLFELEHATFAQVIGILNMGLALALAGIVVFTLRWPIPGLLTALVFGMVQAMPTAIEHAQVIQVSVWLAVAYALAWRWLRNERDVAAGMALGLACTLKFFPGVMVLYLLACRKWRAVFAAALSFLTVAVVMTWRWGIAVWPLFFEQQTTIAKRWLTDVRNGSLHGIVRRAFVDLCEKAPPGDPRATVLILGGAVLLLAAGGWLWRRARARQPERVVLDRSFALFSLLSVFLNPWVWEHYFYLLVLPALIGWHAVATDGFRVLHAWTRRRVSSLRLLVASAGAVLAATPTYAAYLAYRQTFRINWDAHKAACESHGDAALQGWLVQQARFFETINWVPWVLFISLFMVLLAYRVPATDEPRA